MNFFCIQYLRKEKIILQQKDILIISKKVRLRQMKFYKRDIIKQFSQKNQLFYTYHSLKYQKNKLIIYNIQLNINLIKKVKKVNQKMSEQKQEICICSFCKKFQFMEKQNGENQIEEQKENQQNSYDQNYQQVNSFNQQSFQLNKEDFTYDSDLQMIEDWINQFDNLKAVQRQNKVNHDFMKNFVTQYPTSDLSLPDISFHFKPDGSQAILFSIFCKPEILYKCVAKRNDIAKLYYDSKGFAILLVINPKIYYENYEQKYQEFNSNEIPLEAFIYSKFESQQKIFNKFGLQVKRQINIYPLIKNLRLRKDLYELFECLDDQFEFNYSNCSDHCFAYYTQSDNLNQLEGLIIGPQDTPYEGIPYTVTIIIPEDYPIEPPKVTFNQQILHPNISEQGEICLNILQDKWSTVLTIQKVLVSIVSLLYEKNLDDVYNHYAKTLYQEDPEGYRNLIRKQSILQDCQKLKIDYKKLLKVPQKLQKVNGEYDDDYNEQNNYDEYDEQLIYNIGF
ncbi:ubiquitin-conjugating enzyme E2 (macronuclear) [Tetrahymena thermophila SB210]|uniref:Ubiquitin-conjugating enzyme E2 n=1 Tax=Tetrahymena thermophila (strain SB210) TaxID=312017 RepID=Q22BX6_TETTS|nr:ubiquitin-conjugating enzyme E2 [Tetrahymena thermophila SB210]EAR82782.2 ubiquitin-conjugating enzyme E2 [Tetrahymena thermophila SB210]|eukprot:XP_001030445.2 ubiquitin-conjugating enzyme E2 [Tetrahymena thermophila SB210]